MTYDKNKTVNQNLEANGLIKKPSLTHGQYGVVDIFLNDTIVCSGKAQAVNDWMKNNAN